jgi:ankyrin repeat protein
MTPQEATHRLFKAAEAGDLNAAVEALSAGADLAARDDCHRTPLHWAADGGHTDIAQFLIDNGTNPDATDDQKQTALHYAAGWGHVALARLLINQGVNPTAKDDWQRTPLDYAFIAKAVEMIVLLEDAARKTAKYTDRVVAKRQGIDDPQIGG